MIRFYLFNFLLFSFLLASCQGRGKKTPVPTQAEINESLYQVNRNLLKEDSEKISRYIERNSLKMESTGTGLRYKLDGIGIGEKAHDGQFAKIKYKVTLLDGTVCYSSDKNGPEEFLIGMDNVESGIHEGLTLMQVGQKAKFILPPHLAHGLIGNQEKITSRAILIYDIELLNLR
jgi:FKBP-type peptidyl-prolyl cis-trans isomerase FkpA